MQRRLIRLYLYTDEATLNTQQISKLLTALARLEEGVGSLANNEAAAAPQSEVRSTQYQLKKLLAHGYHGLRPRNREVARNRVACFRSVRGGRVQKARSRPPGRAHAAASRDSRSSAILDDATRQALAQLEAPDAASRLGAANLESARSSIAADDLKATQPLHKSVRLSWVRAKLSRSSSDGPSMSVLLEIRSLLSRVSLRRSVVSQTPREPSRSVLFAPPPVLPLDDENSVHGRNRKIISLCCQHQINCIHQRTSHAVTNSIQLTAHELSSGRDVWNETALHMIARWAPDHAVLRTLTENVTPSLMNVQNIDGDTFLHVLAHRIRKALPEGSHIADAGEFATLVHRACWAGYRFKSHNLGGLTFFASLLPDRETPPRSAPLYQGLVYLLRGLLNYKSDVLFYPPTPDVVTTIASSVSKESLLGFLHGQEALLRRGSLSSSNLLEIWTTHSVLSKFRQIYDGLVSSGSVPHASTGSVMHDFLDLMDCNADLRNAISKTHERDQFWDRLELYLTDGIDPNCYNIAHQTVIMTVINMREVTEDFVVAGLTMLAKHGASMKLRDHEGNTPLHHAVKSHRPHVVQHLIKAGIDIYAKNLRGESAIGLAVEQYEQAGLGRGDGENYGRSLGALNFLFDAGARHPGFTGIGIAF
ncbi:hypothetical protein GQ53DRAFT_823569 [Thozetella sp. PMI_491]|nr:hypothetical protein GQ53DRAFT_823569 [Thozetella sp. PMI_491]